jgi:Protein of unknown function with HXXEE motif
VWTAVEASHAGGLGYGRECSNSGVNRIFDAWPYVGSIAMPFVVLFLVRADAFARDVSQQILALQFLILLLHQSEEYVFPGKFVPWWNRVVVRSERSWFPMTKALAFGINVAFGWGLTLLAMLGDDRAAWLFGLVLGTHVINVSAHAAYAIGESRYNPGLVTAVTLLLPSAGSREYQRRLRRLRSGGEAKTRCAWHIA